MLFGLSSVFESSPVLCWLHSLLSLVFILCHRTVSVSQGGSNGLFWQGWGLSGNTFASFSVAAAGACLWWMWSHHVQSGALGFVSGAVEGHTALAAVGGQRVARAGGISPGGRTRVLQVQKQARRLQEKRLVQEWKSGTLTEHLVNLCYRYWDWAEFYETVKACYTLLFVFIPW